MASKKYIKDEQGITRAITTPNLGLEKPLTNENYDVNVFNGNMDKVDKGIKDAKDIANSKAAANHTHDASDINGISTNAKGTSFDNSTNGMAATNVQDAIEENKTSILEHNTRLDNIQKELNGKVKKAETIFNRFNQIL